MSKTVIIYRRMQIKKYVQTTHRSNMPIPFNGYYKWSNTDTGTVIFTREK